MPAARTSKPILCFTHVQKAGGTTVESLLRRYFGLRHLDVASRRGWFYTARDMAADLRLNPFVRSMSGHWLRPFIDYGTLQDRLVWHTMLRDPLDRYLSQYQHMIEKMGVRISFEDFLREPIQKNLQTQIIAGSQDARAARVLLSEGFRCVGLLERFDESMFLLKERAGLEGFPLGTGRARNRAISRATRERVREAAERRWDDVLENNALDRELYDFVARELFPRQVKEYGEERLAQRRRLREANAEPLRRERLREIANDVFRRGVYRPIVLGRGYVARLQGVPDVRR